jgi:hypothetical protein
MEHGQPSMFLYGLLETPLGGPVFFFVEGLAAGFGYNRSLEPPDVASIRQFPLVVDAAGGSPGDSGVDLNAQLERIHEFIAPSLGNYFLAAGIKFTSFKLLDSFALLIVRFGHEAEIDLLGTSTYQTPPGDLGPVPALAHVELNLLARIPLDGEYLKVAAQLTKNSYVYATVCHLSGGFAFSSWFSGEHAGDFVLSVGGYHPRFHPEEHYPHYPVVPRLEVKYQISEDIYIKGDGYFALTPSTFMAGASVEAVANIGSLHASFKMAIDFLIGWEPYHYEANASLYIAARWKCFHTHASADLAIQGPDFGGHAHVEWTVFSFDVDFGKRHNSGPKPIDFDRFTSAFLPATTETSSIRVEGGVIGQLGSGATQRWLVNAKELAITTTSVIPATVGGMADGVEDGLGAIGEGIGVAPMDADVKAASHVITVTRDGARVDYEFTAEAIVTAFPGALWGRSMERGMHDKSIEAISGYRIVPARKPEAGRTQKIKRGDLEYDDVRNGQLIFEPFRAEVDITPLMEFSIDGGTPVPTHSPVLAALGFVSGEVEVSKGFADQYPTERIATVERGFAS